MRQISKVLMCLLSLSFASTAFAADEIYIQAGAIVHPSGKDTPNEAEFGAGWNLPWQWQDGKLVTRLEAGAGYINAHQNDVWNVMATPVLRYKFNGPSADGPFVEAGIGLTYLDKTQLSQGYNLGSHVLFQDRLSIGYTLGANELDLMTTHISSAGMKQPNPGAETVSLRYAHTF